MRPPFSSLLVGPMTRLPPILSQQRIKAAKTRKETKNRREERYKKRKTRDKTKRKGEAQGV